MMDIDTLRLELIKLCFKGNSATQAIETAKILEKYILEKAPPIKGKGKVK
jgi:hypothetical protein